jgi:serine/threonine-protein kinase HipA
VRGNDHFAFEFSREWLKGHGGIILSGDVMNVHALSILVREMACLAL